MKNELKAGALLSYVGLFINSLISIIYTPIMLNFLGQSEYGLYSLSNSVIGYISILNFGLGNAVIRYTAKYKMLKDEESCSKIYGMFFIMYALLGFIAFGVGLILTLNVDDIFVGSLSISELNTLKVLMLIITINISLGIGMGLFGIIILAHEKFIYQKIIVIVSSIVSPLIIVPLLFMGYKSITLAVVTLMLNGITIILYMYYCFYVLRIEIKFHRVEKSLLKEIFIFSSYIFINLLIMKMYESTDQVILGIYSGTIAISIYSIGIAFTGYFSGFSSAISNVFLSKVTGMITNQVSDNELSDLFIRIGRIQYIVISLALSGFIVFGLEFITLWVGKEYQDSYIIAIIILVPMIVSLIQGLGGVILQAKNMQGFRTIVNAAVALLNVLLSVIFVQYWGPIGCAIASAIAFFIGNILVLNVYYWKKIKINIPKFWREITLMSLPLILSITIGTTFNKMILTDLWSIFMLKIIIFLTLYIALMWVTTMNKYEKLLVIKPLQYYYKRFKFNKEQAL